MTLFREIDLETAHGGIVKDIAAGSVGAEIGLERGDVLLAVNDHAVQDVIDVQFYAAEAAFELLVRRGDSSYIFEALRDYNQPLGIEFEHPTFDTDIRRCNNLCEFCFVLQMAPRFRRTLYVKDDDYRYSFLFGHFVTLTNLSDEDWERIEMMRLSPLYISVHVTDTDLRRRFLRNEQAPDIMAQLHWLAARDIEMHTQLVIVPGFNDGPWLERSVEDLEQLWPHVRSISVVPVGLTRHHKYGMRPHTQEEAAETLAFVEGLQRHYQETLGVRFVYPTDEWYLVTGRELPEAAAYDGLQLQENGLGMVRRFLDDWDDVQQEIRREMVGGESTALRDVPPTVTLVTGALFGPTLRRSVEEFVALTGINVEVQVVANKRLGESITVAGLLMAQDIIDCLHERGCGDLVVLPRVVFDHPEIKSLDDVTPGDVAEALDRPVALADMMGDIWDACTGRSLVTFKAGDRAN